MSLPREMLAVLAVLAVFAKTRGKATLFAEPDGACVAALAVLASFEMAAMD